jgi:hypothetical protein
MSRLAVHSHRMRAEHSAGCIPDCRLQFGGRNLFGFLAQDDLTFQEEHDLAITRLLEKHVFSCPGEAKRQQVIDCGDIDGQTLLHHFALCSMPRCVQALISNGAPLNALEYRYIRESDGDASVKVSWYETPLDTAVRVQEKR